MVFGTKREQRPGDTLSREDVIGNLYPDSLSTDVEATPITQAEIRREPQLVNESVIDPHARFNGKYISDRDLRIEGEAQGEIECQGTLIISPQARVRSKITAHNVVVNGDYEGDVDCGGRFEIGSTGRVKGQVKTQVLVVKEGAHWEGSVLMSADAPAAVRPVGTGAPAPTPPTAPQQGSRSGAPVPAQGGGPGNIFSKQDRDAATGPGLVGGGGRNP